MALTSRLWVALLSLRMHRSFTSSESGFCTGTVPIPGGGKCGLVWKQRVGLCFLFCSLSPSIHSAPHSLFSSFYENCVKILLIFLPVLTWSYLFANTTFVLHIEVQGVLPLAPVRLFP
uniref:Secreted protein n=1 Tax=Ixodes scapularis TaxID=6945 RepID=A0A4D5RVQ9_IXOSC